VRAGIVIRSCLLAVLAATSQTGNACGGGMSGVGGDGSARPHTHAQIYRLQLDDSDVILSRVPLDGRPPVQLAKHRIEDGAVVEAAALEIVALSQDRRQALFAIDSSQRAGKQILLFQAKDGRERKVLALPYGALVFGNFSPDGQQLALYAKEVGVVHAPRMGLYLVDTASGKSRYLGGAPGEEETAYGFEPRWSRDGRWLFVGSQRVDIGNGRFEPARRLEAEQAGPCGMKQADIEFQGHQVALAPSVAAQSELGCAGMASPGGSIASFDKDAVLWVESGGERLRVLQAPHDVERFDADGVPMGRVPCGHSYGIAGWIDDRFLVYQLDDSSYLYDLQRRASFEIPGGRDEDRFWW
jgi:hypothetical protein